MKEVIEQVEQREDFRRWLSNGNAQLINYNIGFLDNWKYEFPLTAKLAMMQEWLRESEDMVVIVDGIFSDETFFWSINYDLKIQDRSSETYNEALAEGIREALKLIKY